MDAEQIAIVDDKKIGNFVNLKIERAGAVNIFGSLIE